MSGIDYNDAARSVVIAGAGKIPEAGGVIGALVGALWPENGVDVWAQIRDRTRQMIDQAIADDVYTRLTQQLEGLRLVIGDYLGALHSRDHAATRDKWSLAEGLCHDAAPGFEDNRYPVSLLPLFAQFANLHLGLLRDGALYCRAWEYNADYEAFVRGRLTQTIADYCARVDSILPAAVANMWANIPTDNHHVEPFRTANGFQRQLTLTVDDYRQSWPWLDISIHPNGAGPLFVPSREIYSDPFGSVVDTGPIDHPRPPPTGLPCTITVWGWDRIDAIKVDYDSNRGPRGVPTTGRMGNQDGGSNQPPHGQELGIRGNPVIQVNGRCGEILNAVQFVFSDGRPSWMFGGGYPGGGDFSVSYPNEVLCSIWINGVDRHYGSADCAIFGFCLDAELIKRNAADLHATYFSQVSSLRLTASPVKGG